MRVVFDGRAILNELDGTGRYSLNVLSEVAGILGNAALVVLIRQDLDRRTRELFPQGVQLHEIPYRHVSPRTLTQLGTVVDSFKPDIFHSPFMLQPLFMNAPGIITIHDAMWWKHPGLQAKRDPIRITVGWLYYRTAMHMCVTKARRIVTVSQASKKDIEKSWPQALAKLVVISEGVDRCFLTGHDRAGGVDVLKRLNVETDRYFLHITNARPYKNTTGLLRAFADIADRCDHPMVIVGNLGRFRSAVLHTIEELRLDNRMRIAGRLPDEEMVILMRNATCLAFPSFFEGFGLPVAEAMAAGCPVLTSDRGALAEVVGDAAVIVDPNRIASISQGLLRLAGDRGLRDDLRRRGAARAAKFSWSEVAAKITEVYEDILRQPVSRG